MEKHRHHGSSSYSSLIWMGLLHVPVMYALMFSMVDGWRDFYMNLNMFYMAVTMAAPMVALMPLMMAAMYPAKKKNLAVYGSSVALIALFLLFIRAQAGIGDKQFVRSMIPHHSGAILMCREASLKDEELKILCVQIIEAQRNEIEQMRRILERL